MNPELMMNQKIVLVCEDCGKKSDAEIRDDLVDFGWNWQEFEINDAGIERVALCSNCFSSEKLIEAISSYKESRINNGQQSLDELIEGEE